MMALKMEEKAKLLQKNKAVKESNKLKRTLAKDFVRFMKKEDTKLVTNFKQRWREEGH